MNFLFSISFFSHIIRDPNKQEVGFIFAWSGSELWTVIKYSRSKIKNKKPIAFWCSFQGLSNGTTLMQIQSGRMVPFNLAVTSRHISFEYLKSIRRTNTVLSGAWPPPGSVPAALHHPHHHLPQRGLVNTHPHPPLRHQQVHNLKNKENREGRL